jgi:hypothetical protein
MRDDNLAVNRLWSAKAASDDNVLPRGKRSIFTVGNAATGNDDVRALLGKGQRSCFADTGSASSDPHHIVFECRHSRCLTFPLFLGPKSHFA